MAGSINKPKKPKSKRQPTRLRHRIEKASAAKQRKQRKLAKQNPEWRSKLKKDPGIPNLFPYKEKLLNQIEEAKVKKQEENQRRREMAKEARRAATQEPEGGDNDDEEEEDDDDMEDADVDGMDVEDDNDEDDDDAAVDESNPMAALLASARRAAKVYDAKKKRGGDGDNDDDMDGDYDDDDDNDVSDNGQVIEVHGGATSRRAYDKVFKQVVEQADVVLYVLDARDPEGTRSRDVERAVLAASAADAGGKRLILVLNKADLVPPPVLHAWLAHLRGFFPTLPLRASNPAPNAHTFHHRDLSVASTSTALFRALKSFAAGRNMKRAVSVGVIGYPNVGKSSVINALLSRLGGGGANSNRSACPAGAEAGVTTAIRSVKIDSKLTILDSPGIVFPSSTTIGGGTTTTTAQVQASLILLNAVPPKLIEDPVPAVTLLLRRLESAGAGELLQKLMDVYGLPPLMMGSGGDVTTDFLVQVARKRGRLGRGGVPNIHAAAMTVITDWRDGRIQGWVDAPTHSGAAVATKAAAAKAGAAGQVSGGIPSAAPSSSVPIMADHKEIVTEWAKEFKLDGLWGDDSSSNGDAMVE